MDAVTSPSYLRRWSAHRRQQEARDAQDWMLDYVRAERAAPKLPDRKPAGGGLAGRLRRAGLGDALTK